MKKKHGLEIIKFQILTEFNSSRNQWFIKTARNVSPCELLLVIREQFSTQELSRRTSVLGIRNDRENWATSIFLISVVVDRAIIESASASTDANRLAGADKYTDLNRNSSCRLVEDRCWSLAWACNTPWVTLCRWKANNCTILLSRPRLNDLVASKRASSFEVLCIDSLLWTALQSSSWACCEHRAKISRTRAA